MIKYITIINHPLSDTQSTQLASPHTTKSSIGQFYVLFSFVWWNNTNQENCRINDLVVVKHADDQLLNAGCLLSNFGLFHILSSDVTPFGQLGQILEGHLLQFGINSKLWLNAQLRVEAAIKEQKTASNHPKHITNSASFVICQSNKDIWGGWYALPYADNCY